jgi:hypothetical protein
MIDFQVLKPPFPGARAADCELLSTIQESTVTAAKLTLKEMRASQNDPTLVLRYYSLKLERYMLID